MSGGEVALKMNNAVVTPMRKAASYEQRKTNLGNQIFGAVLSRSGTYYAALTRVSSIMQLQYSACFRMEWNTHTARYRICHELATYFVYEAPSA